MSLHALEDIGLYPIVPIRLALVRKFQVPALGKEWSLPPTWQGDPWGLGCPERLADRFAFLQPALARNWYLDDFYYSYIVVPLKRFSGRLATFVDQQIIDGAVNGIADVTGRLGGALRKAENGNIPTYALSILIGAVLLIAYFLFNI